jgi:hypothetical protein
MTTIQTIRLCTAITAAFGLAGCVGSTEPLAAAGSSAATTTSTSTSTSSAQAIKIDIDGLDRLSGEFTEQDRYFRYWKPAGAYAIPITGSATFNGIAAFGEGASYGEINGGDADMVADMALTVNFGTSKVTGAMWDFHDKNGKVGAGSIALKGNQDSTTVKADGTSTIHWGDANEILTVDMDGYFLANQYGIKGTLATSSLGAGGEVNSTGIVILKSDSAP